MTPIRCGFRQDVIRTEFSETACCELLRRITADQGGQASRVDRSACEYCFGDGGIDPRRLSQVLGSAVLASGPVGRFEPRDSVTRRIKQLADYSVGQSANKDEQQPATAIDVVLPVETLNDATRKTIDSWLGQQEVYVVLHLVTVAQDCANNWQEYREIPFLRFHHFDRLERAEPDAVPVSVSDDPITAAFFAAHAITAKLETPFLALGWVGVLPDAMHLSHATKEMVDRGIEWYAAAIQYENNSHVERSTYPDQQRWRRTIRSETAVIRRSLWVDLNGISDRRQDTDVDFFSRAARQRRAAFLSDQVVARGIDARHSDDIGPAPKWFTSPQELNSFQMHHCAMGFKTERLACDVVLPFRGQLGFVEQAIDSILDQTDIDVVLHLIDDLTEENIDDWLRQYLADSRVRVYRNEQNIGQFMSFNNVAEFFETDWVATQDGDDVSLPSRLSETVQIAKLCDADIVGAATILDGPIEELQRISHVTTTRGNECRHHRISYPPHPHLSAYFLENPTLVHRRAFFERVGGFADFANPLRNRTTVDSEYMLRSLYAGANIVACRRLAVRYRVHPESAIHREETRMGSPIRKSVENELVRRMPLYRRGGIDPKVFGSLGRHRGITRQWKG